MKKDSNRKKIVMAVAGVLVIACIVMVIAIISLTKKQKDVETSKKNETEQVGDANNQDENNQNDTSNADLEENNATIGDYSTYLEYVSSLASYTGIEVNMKPEVITDEEVEEQLNTIISMATSIEEITDRDVVQNGDVVNIDIVGLMDGVEFEGGSSKDYNLTIGSQSFIPGFEEGLIGKKVGETVDLNLTFPDDYLNEEYAGKDATFTVTINKIQVAIKGELTDEWVSKNSEWKTVDEYRANVRKKMEEQAEQTLIDSKANRILETVYKNSTMNELPEDELKSCIDSMNSYYEYMASMYGMSLEELIAAKGMTEDEFNEQMSKSAEITVGSKIVCFCIAANEKMTLTDEEYQEAALAYAQEYELESVEALEAQYTKSVVYDQIIMDRVLEYVSANAIEIND